MYGERLTGEVRVVEHDAVERNDRRHAADLELIEGAPRPRDRLGPGRAGHDQLGQQRVERAGHGVALDVAGVDPDARPARRAPGGDVAGGGQEASTGVLGIDPELDRVTARRRVGAGEPLAVGDRELREHQVDPTGLLGDRVLDLEPGVDLEEGDGAVLRDEELAGAGADVPGGLRDRLAG